MATLEQKYEVEYQEVPLGCEPIERGWKDERPSSVREGCQLWMRSRAVSDYTKASPCSEDAVSDEEIAIARVKHENKRMLYSYTTFGSMTEKDQRIYYDDLAACRKACDEIVHRILSRQEVSIPYLLNLLTGKRKTL